VVSQGLARYQEGFERRVDPRGRTYFWSKIEYVPGTDEEDTDLAALSKHYVTVTPLHVDLTDRSRLVGMRNWGWRLLE
jgi:5'-nucleotidase